MKYSNNTSWLLLVLSAIALLLSLLFNSSSMTIMGIVLVVGSLVIRSNINLANYNTKLFIAVNSKDMKNVIKENQRNKVGNKKA
jgi:hypothetical protein